MPDSLEPSIVKYSKALYQRLTAIYPGEYRREFGAAMTQLFGDQCRDAFAAAAGWGVCALWLRTFPDMAASVLREHTAAMVKKTRAFSLRGFVHTVLTPPKPPEMFRTVFAGTFVFAVICSLMLMFWYPKSYSSTAQIFVDYQTTPRSFDPYYLATQFAVIKSEVVLREVAIKLGLMSVLPAHKGELPPWTVDQTLDWLREHVSVAQTRGTRCVEISAETPSPELAHDIVNAICARYKELRENPQTTQFDSQRSVRILNWGRVSYVPNRPRLFQCLIIGTIAGALGGFALGSASAILMALFQQSVPPRRRAG